MTSRHRTATVVVGVLLAVAMVASASVLPGAVGTANAQSNTITSCTTIDSPGTYTLGSDIRVDDADACIEITASNVVLDGNGHTVSGGVRWPISGGFAATPNGTEAVGQKGTDGIYASGVADAPLTNVVVRDLTTVGWDNGTRYEHVDGGAIRSVTARKAAMNAIRVSHSDNNRISAITLLNNSEPNYDFGGGGHGLYLTRDSSGNTVSGVDARQNKYTVLLDGGSDDNVVRNVRSTGGTYATYLYAASNNRIVNLSSTDNQRFPVYAEIGAEENVFRNLRIDSATLNLKGTNFALKPVPSASVASAPSAPDGQGSLGQYVQLYTTSTKSAAFSARMAISYSQSALGDAPESSIGVWHNQNDSWTEVPGSSVNAEANLAAAAISNESDLVPSAEFSPVGIFAPLADGNTNPPTRTDAPTPAGTSLPSPTPSETPATATPNGTPAATPNGTPAVTDATTQGATTAASTTVASTTAGSTTEEMTTANATAGNTTTASATTESIETTGMATDEPTATPTDELTDTAAATDTPTEEATTTTNGGGPGFGLLAALAGLLVSVALLARELD